MRTKCFVLVVLLAAPVLASVSFPVVVSDRCNSTTHVGVCTISEYDGSVYAIYYRDVRQSYERPGGLSMLGYNNRFDERVDNVLRVVRLR